MDNLTNRTLSKKVRYIRIYTVWSQLHRRQKHTEVIQDIIGQALDHPSGGSYWG